MFLTDIRLVGGRGYGIFIQTDSRRLDVETGDEILEVCGCEGGRKGWRREKGREEGGGEEREREREFHAYICMHLSLIYIA